MDTIRKHAVEVIGSVWLVIVAVQYLSRYFMPESGGPDFMFAYIAMLCVTIGVVVYRTARSRADRRR